MKVNQYLNLDEEGISLYPYVGVNNHLDFSIIRKSQGRETFESNKGLIIRITNKIIWGGRISLETERFWLVQEEIDMKNHS